MADIKHYAVVCNNLREWELFVELSTFNLSKQNHPYKLSLQGKRLVDLHKDICYICVHNSPNNMCVSGILIEKIIQMCSAIDGDLYARLVTQIK